MARLAARRRLAALLAGAGLALAACGGARADAPTTTAALPDTTTATTDATAASTTTTATPATTTTTAPPAFTAAMQEIDDAIAALMTASWRPGCPVGLDELRLLTLGHWGFDGAVHRGELVVHRDVADGVVGVFRQLFDARFPIERMELVDVYGGDDDRSTMANNTSAFNCRRTTSGTRWSEHAFGTAVDINPVQNPYVSNGQVLDPEAARYVDRGVHDPGTIHDGDVVVQAFAAIGWGWGGHWSSVRDYQHFSASGR